MLDLEKSISTIVESQFPEFYREEGPLFVLFVKEYYKWLEENYTQLTVVNASNFAVGDTVTQGSLNSGIVEYKSNNTLLVRMTKGFFVVDNTNITSSSGGSSLLTSNESTNVLYFSRNLTKIKDLDFTTDNFLVYFKEKYLKGIQFDTFTAKRTLIKASQDLYSSKGTERSIDLLFKLVFGQGASVYYPGDDVLRPSHGQWVIPRYLEVTVTSKGPQLVGRQVRGSISGAVAFCEKLIKRNIKGKIMDVLYLSNIQGNFQTGDLVVDETGLVANAPKVIGSLSSIDITISGELFQVGEEVLLYSERGVGARALITEIVTETGLVRFTLIDGGWGFANTSDIIISEKVLGVANVTNTNTLITSFSLFERIEQPITQIVSNNVTGTLLTGNFFTNPEGASGVIVNINQVSGSNVATIKVNGLSGNLTSNLNYRVANQQWLAVEANNSTSNDFIVGELIYQSNGSANVTVGTLSELSNVTIITTNTTSISSNGIHVGMYAYQPATLATATVAALPWTSYTNYSSVPYVVLDGVRGSFSNTDTIQFRPSSANLTVVTSATPLNAANGSLLKLIAVSGSRWYQGNTIYGSLSSEVNSPIVVSDVGGVVQSTSNVTASGNVNGTNATSVGVFDIDNTFYAVSGSRIRGLQSNTTATVTNISFGQGANAEINQLLDTETVRLPLDFLKDYNSNDVLYMNMLITGANSSYGFVGDVIVANGGTGYDNTNIVIYTGGNTGVGSYEAGNGTILTDNSGSIIKVLMTSNSGSGYTTNPTVTIANSTGGSSGIGTGGSVLPVFSLGFPKFEGGTINTPLLEILRFNNLTIGTIASLWKINPGENYNIKPFVVAYEPAVAERGAKDIILSIYNLNGPDFSLGENITQTTNSVAVKLFANTFSGNTALQRDEFVYSTDGIQSVAFGEVYTYNSIASNNYQIVVKNQTGTFSNTINSVLLTVGTTIDFNIGDKVIQGSANGIVLNTNTTHMVLKDAQGTFAANSTNATSNSGGSSTITLANNTFKSYIAVGDISNTRFIVTNTAPDTASAVARGIVKSSNSSTVVVRRKSLFTTFVPTTSNNLIGEFSGSNAAILNVTQDLSSNGSGINAIIDANVSFNVGAIACTQITDSGFGYESGEGITIYSQDFQKSASAKANITTSGIGTGYYATRDGFLSDSKKLHDGYYYQDYSYEVESPIPLDKYNVMLKEVLHVAGTIFFGRVKTAAIVNTNFTVATSNVEIS